nr:hypothetical protein [Escherichia coli]
MQRRLFNVLKVASAPLWTKNVFDIAVEYSKEPTMRTVDTLNVYTVPDFNIRAAMEIEDKKDCYHDGIAIEGVCWPL